MSAATKVCVWCEPDAPRGSPSEGESHGMCEAHRKALEYSGPGRLCVVCAGEGRKSATKAGIRHLHELRPGDRFRFPLQGTKHALVELGSGRCEITTGTKPERVEFRTLEGEAVEFVRSSSSTRPCSPFAQVEPVH